MATGRSRPQGRAGLATALLPAVAAAGALDVATFLWRRRKTIFSSGRARACGALLGLGLWLALGLAANRARARPEAGLWSTTSGWLAMVCGFGNVALFSIHLRIGRGRGRSAPGAVLGLLALALGARQLSRSGLPE